MNASPSADAERADQIRLLKDSAIAFAAGRMPLSRSRRLRGARPEFEPAMFAELAGQGWTGLLVPESLGGFGLGFAEARVVVEALAAQLAPEPLVPVAVLAAGVLRRCGDSPVRDALLTALAEGKAAPALAWQNVDGGLDAGVAPFSARREGEGWTLSGEARFVRPGSGATHLLLLAQIDGAPGVFVAEAGASGLKLSTEPLADGTGMARVRADQLRIPYDHLLRLDREALERTLDEATVMNAVELLALMSRMRAMTLDYIKTRVQFGKPIGSFQVLQHRAVDMLIQEELAQAVVTEAVAALDAPETTPQQRASLASRAKARAAESLTQISRESIQLHGGIAVTDEYDLSLYVNRTLALLPWLGNALAHRRRYVRLNPPTPESED
ncbi:MAG: acyl-CoA dehydrogenase family protein [Panacagrimonas sp.]